EPGRSLKGAKLFELLAKQPAGWFYSESRFKDQIPRLLVYRAVKDFPLVVAVGRSTREIFAAPNAKRRSYNIIAGLLTLLILVAIAHSVHGGLRLERASEELRRQNARFQAALDNMPHGISMYDAQGGFMVSIAQRIVDLDNAAADALQTGARLIRAEVPAQTVRGPRVINSLRLMAP